MVLSRYSDYRRGNIDLRSSESPIVCTPPSCRHGPAMTQLKRGHLHLRSTFESELGDITPIPHTTIGGTRIVRQLTAGMHFLITYQELQHIWDALPDSGAIQRAKGRLPALGNVIVCNDYVALVHPDVDHEMEEIITNVLKAQVSRQTVVDNVLVGSCCIITNQGGLVRPKTSIQAQGELSSLLQVLLAASSVNHDSDVLGAGCAFTGYETAATEADVIEATFELEGQETIVIVQEMRDALIDTMAYFVVLFVVH
ncbi:hypothetical protein BOTBODRAFT_56021 [Botryobasidium botryosum FD-172 SS1]|uniref:EIF-6 n=1 Tax=Botryobasidium botryosum (strain FD-172 SS1) TaxID=930990 RepID=A0A067MD58_BOTB1|nr:hypothetical protein BOTBODRAFT_56021 [Botryobasidium botryosum FD-172 SS1]